MRLAYEVKTRIHRKFCMLITNIKSMIPSVTQVISPTLHGISIFFTHIVSLFPYITSDIAMYKCI